MELKILIFWLAIYGVVMYFRFKSESTLSHVLFSWIGPVPKSGERLSEYHLKWSLYSTGWLCQFCIVFCTLWILLSYYPGLYERTWFQVLWFAIPFGVGISLLASLGFVFKYAKARYVGPNPACSARESK